MGYEIAWAAGLFEGEGCFYQRKAKPGISRSYLAMTLTTTDEDVMRRFTKIAGCGHLGTTHRNPTQWKPQWNWKAQGAPAEAFAQQLLPYLGQRRSARLEEILTAVRASEPQPRPCQCCGDTFEPVRFGRERFCSERCRDLARYLRRKYDTSYAPTAALRGFQGAIPGTRP